MGTASREGGLSRSAIETRWYPVTLCISHNPGGHLRLCPHPTGAVLLEATRVTGY